MELFLIPDINECEQPGLCGPHGECLNTDSSFHCICEQGFSISADVWDFCHISLRKFRFLKTGHSPLSQEIPFVFIAVWQSIARRHSNVFIQSVVNRHLGYFQFSALCLWLLGMSLFLVDICFYFLWVNILEWDCLKDYSFSTLGPLWTASFRAALEAGGSALHSPWFCLGSSALSPVLAGT